MREEIRKIQSLMEAAEYVTDAPVATSVHLAQSLRKPLLIEGHAGVGKTEVAKVMARMLDTNLIRLQCYEGLDASTALYEWNYQKQLLHIKLDEGAHKPVDEEEHEIFSEKFLLRRPLLQAITQEKAPVLLVDEVDRCVTGDTLVATVHGVKRAATVQPGDGLISFDPDAFRMTRATVKKVIPRSVSGVLRILAGGRLIEVTSEHKFARYSGAGYEVVEAAELRPGDRLPLHKSLHVGRLHEPVFEFEDDIVKLNDADRRLLHAAYRRTGRTYEQLASGVSVSASHLSNALGPHPVRRSLRAGVLARVANSLGVDGAAITARPAGIGRVCQSAAFYEILGYIVADGCFTSDRLCVADKDRANLEVYAAKFAEAFSRPARIRQGPHRNFELTCHSLPLGRFLQKVLGPAFGRSRTRRVPDFVFGLPSAKRAAFVRGFFDGEGWVAHHQVAAVSASSALVVGMQQLLSSLGVDSHITTTRAGGGAFGRGPFFQLTVSDVTAFDRAVGFCAPAKQQRLAAISTASRYTRTETLPRPAVVEALEHLKARTTLHRVPCHQTVHDILGDRVHANVSSLRRIADAFDAPEVRDLLDREVVLGTVMSIEPVEGEQTVYDFVLDGSPYFVANQVVTHNCDEEFEAFMLEVFSDWQVTIPEIGTIKATHPPHVILTSNRTRELSDALRRRCLYLWIDYPDYDKEVAIVHRKVPGIDARLAREVARFMESLRKVRLAKVPGVAETLDWANALAGLHADHLDETLVNETLGCVLKDADDMKRFRAEVGKSGLAPFVKTG